MTVPGDPLAANNTLDRGVVGRIRAPKVLYVEGTPASARYLSARAHRIRLRRHRAAARRACRRRRRSSSRATSSCSATCARRGHSRRVDGGAVRLGGERAAAGCWSPAARRCSAKAGYRKTPTRAAHAGDLRAAGRAGGRADPRARSVVEHGRRRRWICARPRRRRRSTCMTDEQSRRRPHLQRQVQLGRHAAQRRQEPRRDPQEDRRDRAGRPHADFPGRRAGLSRARKRGRAPSTSSCCRTADRIRTTTRGSSKMVEARITVSSVAVGPAADPELLAQHRQMGQGTLLRRRGREGAAADLRQGSEERGDARLRRKGDQAGREDAGVPRRHGPDAAAAAEGAHRHGAQGHGARGAGDRRRTIRCWRSGRSGSDARRCSRRT